MKTPFTGSCADWLWRFVRRFFAWLWDMRPGLCRHKRRIIVQQFRDGCPYVKVMCEDCMYQDEGPVIVGDRSDWEEKIIHVRE